MNQSTPFVVAGGPMSRLMLEASRIGAPLAVITDPSRLRGYRPPLTVYYLPPGDSRWDEWHAALSAARARGIAIVYVS